MVRVIFIFFIIFTTNVFSSDNIISIDYFYKPPTEWNGITEGYARVSFKKLLHRAKKGDVSAQLHLGDILYQGYGVERDKAEALKWWKLAANNQSILQKHWSVVACYRMAYYYEGKDKKKMNIALKKALKLSEPKVIQNLQMLKGIY